MVLLGRGRFRETKSALHRNKHVLLVAKATLLLLTRDRTLHPLLRFLSPLALLTLLCRAAFRVLPSPPSPPLPCARDCIRTGLHKNDFVLAAKLDAIPIMYSPKFLEVVL